MGSCMSSENNVKLQPQYAENKPVQYYPNPNNTYPQATYYAPQVPYQPNVTQAVYYPNQTVSYPNQTVSYPNQTVYYPQQYYQGHNTTYASAPPANQGIGAGGAFVGGLVAGAIIGDILD